MARDSHVPLEGLDWSPVINQETEIPDSPINSVPKKRVLLALGGKRMVTIWEYYFPSLADERDRFELLPSSQKYKTCQFPHSSCSIDYRFELINSFEAHMDWTSTLSWHPREPP